MSLTLIKLPVSESDIPNSVPELPINATPPSCRASNRIEEVKLPENTIDGLTELPLNARSII